MVVELRVGRSGAFDMVITAKSRFVKQASCLYTTGHRRIENQGSDLELSRRYRVCSKVESNAIVRLHVAQEQVENEPRRSMRRQIQADGYAES